MLKQIITIASFALLLAQHAIAHSTKSEELSTIPVPELLGQISKKFNIQQPADCISGINKEGTIPKERNTDTYQGACTAVDFKAMTWSYGFATIQDVKKAFNTHTDARVKEMLKRPDSPISCVMLLNFRDKQFHYYIFKKSDGIKRVLLHALGEEVLPDDLEPFLSTFLLGGYTPASTIYYILRSQFRATHASVPNIYYTNYKEWPPNIQTAYDQFEKSKESYFKSLQEQANQWIKKNSERSTEELLSELRQHGIGILDFPRDFIE